MAKTLASKKKYVTQEELKSTIQSINRNIDNVEQNLDDRTQLLYEIRAGLSALSFQIYSHIEEHNMLNAKIDILAESVSAMQYVRVNGTVGLKEVLENLYNATRSKRIGIKLIQDFKEWKKTNNVAKIVFGTKVGIMIFLCFNIFAILSILFALGAITTNPLEIAKAVFGLVAKIL